MMITSEASRRPEAQLASKANLIFDLEKIWVGNFIVKAIVQNEVFVFFLILACRDITIN